MKVTILITLAIIIGGGIVYTSPQLRATAIKSLSYSECDTPISYKLGTLDSKFSLSQKIALANIQSAADIWNKTYGKSLFTHSSSAVLTINFIYDQRSALDSQINQLQNKLDQKNTTLQQQISAYESDVAAFEKKLASFNAQVNQVNRSGGASPEEYNNLIAQQNALNQEGQALNARAKQLNLSTRDYNSNVQNLNQNINQFNQAIVQKPEEGLYNGGDNTITIYFANNRQELIHTLAHELGHALGMLHNDDPLAIMYPYTTSSLSVTAQDKQLLDYVCRDQPLPLLWLHKFSTWLRKSV